MSELKRELKARHLAMIAIGGAIGTGLFVGTGVSLSTAGPGGTLAAYAIIGIMVYFLMTSLGEMATYMPVSGSFESYATKFVDPALGFALGWNYWYSWAITVASELVAAALVMKFWFPTTPAIVWSAAFLAILFILNILSARSYGEAEYWFAGIKVIAIIVFLIVGTLIIFGLLGGEYVGFRNLTIQDAPFVGGLLGIFGIFMIAGYSFQGTELVGIAAGESEHPETDVPKAINSVFWRILLFYIGALFVVSCIIPYTHPNLLQEGIENIAISPFTLVFERAGFAFAAFAMNFVILTSVLSCGNSGLYVSTRMLYALAKEGKAPQIFARVNRRGVPANALYFTTLIGMAAFLTSFFGEGAMYTWLLNAAGLTGFIAWVGIAISHYRFRKAYLAQGKDLGQLKYRAKFYPFGPLFAFALCVIVILGQNYKAFMAAKIDWNSILVSYIGLPIFLALWLIYKMVKQTKVTPLQNCDLNPHG